MGAESANQVATSAGAVFLSYASQDAEAAQRICAALRSAGVKVWFDQSELRGGDAWDRQIRERIHDCRLFIPVISANTEVRDEGYFRHEWKLAVERTHHMSEKKPFLVPVVIDDTRERGASVPDKLHEVQWTRLPGGETPPEFVAHVARLLSSESSTAPTPQRPVAVPSGGGPIPPTTGRALPLTRVLPVTIALLAAAVLAYLLVDKLWSSKRGVAAPPSASTAVTASPSPATPETAAFAPPPHSIAVLPFVNMSGDKKQEYFSDGLSEELLNSLSRINELQVAARTSSFYFKGKDVDLGTVARKLNVAAVLEGSVRKSSKKVRVTAQLVNAVTGFHLWSQTYDRDLGDVLELQTEIAEAVASALRISLLGGAAEKVELGGTRNPAAFDAYLRGLKLARGATASRECRAPVDAFSEAITRDPSYALAYASRALVRWDCATYYTSEWLQQAVASGVRADAGRAIELAPALSDGYVARSNLESGLLRFSAADEACTRALALAPSNEGALYYCSQLGAWLGRGEAAINLARRGVALDPLNPRSYRALGDALRAARRYDEAVAAYQASIAVDPEHANDAYTLRGWSYYLAGHLSEAQSSCEVIPDYVPSLVCQAVIYSKLGRRRDASTAMANAVREAGDGAAYQYAQIHAQWEERTAALDALERAMRLRDPGMIYLKLDPLLDPLRNEPRFKAIERELKFPN